VSGTHGWKVTLLGIALLAGAGLGQAKAVILNASNGTPAADSQNALTRVSRQSDSSMDYVQLRASTLGLEQSYGILALSANEQYSNKGESTAARGGIESFRELSDNNERRTVPDRNGGSTSLYNGERGTTSAGVALLIMGGLATYQLRRKQQLLKHLPFSP